MLSPLRRSGFDVKAKQVELLRRCLKKGEKDWQVWLRSYPELTGAASRRLGLSPPLCGGLVRLQCKHSLDPHPVIAATLLR